jgi:hypothetical protein
MEVIVARKSMQEIRKEATIAGKLSYDEIVYLVTQVYRPEDILDENLEKMWRKVRNNLQFIEEELADNSDTFSNSALSDEDYLVSVSAHLHVNNFSLSAFDIMNFEVLELDEASSHIAFADGGNIHYNEPTKTVSIFGTFSYDDLESIIAVLQHVALPEIYQNVEYFSEGLGEGTFELFGGRGQEIDIIDAVSVARFGEIFAQLLGEAA